MQVPTCLRVSLTKGRSQRSFTATRTVGDTTARVVIPVATGFVPVTTLLPPG
jgi:hypothetical protein